MSIEYTVVKPTTEPGISAKHFKISIHKTKDQEFDTKKIRNIVCKKY